MRCGDIGGVWWYARVASFIHHTPGRDISVTRHRTTEHVSSQEQRWLFDIIVQDARGVSSKLLLIDTKSRLLYDSKIQ